MAVGTEGPLLRIGELSRRVGVSDHVLRAWETRYGLLQPARSTGGYRLYSEADEFRIRRMQAYLDQGLSAAEAARAVLHENVGGIDRDPHHPRGAEHATSITAELATALRNALDAFDEPAAQAALDQLLSDVSLATALRDVVIPYFTELGERWQRGDISVAQEHFASNIVRGRLSGLARGWGSGHGPRAVLACPPGEQHDIALLVFGIMLNRQGWRIDYLGANTPVDELAHTVDAAAADLVVLAVTTPGVLTPLRRRLAALAQQAPMALAGAGATPRFANAIGARVMRHNPVTEAEQVPWPR
jgi:MerR family transcriptional regulator, light-induced transcriptional regulator